MALTVGVLTISDRCAAGLTPDASGPLLAALIAERGWVMAQAATVPDDRTRIADAIRLWIDEAALSLVLTTGGTGIGKRDVTPEATAPLLDQLLPGLPELLRREGLAHTPTAVLSRGLAGLRGRALVVNFPGNPAAVRQGFATVAPYVEHILAVRAGAHHDKGSVLA